MIVRHKYRAKRVNYDGQNFASKLEAAVYQILKLRERAGEIEILATQETVYLTAARIAYKPDFTVMDKFSGQTVHVEAKGLSTPVWAIKKRLWAWYGPGALEIWKGKYSRPYLDEIVIPKGAV
jgi:hypothetical protein